MHNTALIGSLGLSKESVDAVPGTCVCELSQMATLRLFHPVNAVIITFRIYAMNH